MRVAIDKASRYSRSRRQWLLLIAAALCAVLVAFGIGKCSGGDSVASGQKLYDTRAVISHYLRELYGPGPAGLERAYAQLVSENPSLLRENQTNRGAEILFRLFGQSTWYADTDGDGLPEACDAFGTPLLFFTSDFASDLIVFPDGGRQRVYAPPYFTSGFYINSIRCHSWRTEEQEALEEARRAAKPAGSAATSRSDHSP